jgi:hypothetical protein
MIEEAALGHAFERGQRHFPRAHVTSRRSEQKELQIAGPRKLGRLAETSVAPVERRFQRFAEGLERPLIEL